jgi:hypothetical protein
VLGQSAQLTFALLGASFELRATVVRYTEGGGFALVFDEEQVRLGELIETELRKGSEVMAG